MSDMTATGAGEATAADIPSRHREREHRQYRFAVFLFILSQAAAFFLLINVRYALAGSDVLPGLSPLLGGLLPTLLLAVSCAPVWLAMRALNSGDWRRVKKRAAFAWWLGLAALATMVWPLASHSFDAFNPYGEVYLTALGVSGFFTVVALIALGGVVIRARKNLIAGEHAWSAEAAALFWNFNALGWSALYIVFYFV